MYAGIYPVQRGPLEYFDFVSGHNERSDLVRSGRLPWWTSPDIRLAVLRPLASALTWLDFEILNAQRFPWRARIHSLVWWLALMSGAAALLGRALPLSAAAIAIAFYAIHKSHALPVTWNANRSELVALTCVYWGTWAHWRSRASEGWYLRVIAIVLVGLGILAGEHALPPLTYLVLSEIRGVGKRARSTIAALAPYAVLIFGFLIVRHWLGYGLRGSSFYVDPFSEPLRFLVAVSQRFPLMVGDVALGLAGEWFYVGAPWREALLDLELLPREWLSIGHLGALQQGVGWVAFAVVLAAIVQLRRSAEPTHRSLAWLLLAAHGSIVLGCGTLAFSRMTMAAALGFCAAWGVLLRDLLSRLRVAGGLRRHKGSALVIVALLAVHGVHAAYRTHHETAFYADSSRRELATALSADLPRDLGNAHVIIIRAIDWLSQFALPYARHMHGRTVPASSETLLPLSLAPVELHRVSSHVLDVTTISEAPDGFLFERSVYALDDVSFAIGQRFPRSRFTVEVMEVNAGKPTRLRFAFLQDLDDERYIFLYPFKSGLRRVGVPPVAQSFTLPTPVVPLVSATP